MILYIWHFIFDEFWYLKYTFRRQQGGKRSPETAIKAPKTAPGRQDALTVSNSTHTHNKPCHCIVIIKYYAEKSVPSEVFFFETVKWFPRRLALRQLFFFGQNLCKCIGCIIIIQEMFYIAEKHSFLIQNLLTLPPSLEMLIPKKLIHNTVCHL